MANLASRLYPPCLRAYRRSLKRFGPIHAFCYALGNGLLSVVSPAIGFRTNSDDPLWWRLSLTTGSHEAATRQTFAKIVRPGMTAEVTLLLAEDAAESGYYLVPLTAVAPGDQAGEGFVFVYDRESSTVRRTLVKAAQALSGNVVAVSGVTAGDVVATAGVNFLVDGQSVTLMAPTAGG